MKYIDIQKQKNIDHIKSGCFFGDDNGNGINIQNGVRYPYVLNNAANNLHFSIRDDVIQYFESNNIALDSIERTVNSQAACLNHLFPLRYDETAVMNILKTIRFRMA